MPSRDSSSVSRRPRDSEAAFVCGGRSSGCARCRFSLRLSRRGGCCLMSSCAGKSRALSAPAKAPSFGSSSSRPMTSQTPSFTPSRRTGPSSSRCDSMKNKGSSGGGLGAASIVPPGSGSVGSPSSGVSCGAASFVWFSALRLVIRSSSFFNSLDSFALGCWEVRRGRCSAARRRPWRTGPGRGPTTAMTTAAFALPPPRSSAPSAIRRNPAQTMANRQRPEAA